jgi:predicted SnoaL-like aldol condensation-catalyzing enzyme
VEFFEGFVERNPKREIEILHGIEDGRYAFLHVYQSLNHGAQKWVTMDVFDTDAEGLIREHWDVIQAYSESTASGAGMIGDPSEVVDLERSSENKEIVLEYTKQVLQARHVDRIDRFVAPSLVQHNPSVTSGTEALAAWITSDEAGDYEMLFKLVGQGNLVATLGKRHVAEKDYVAADLYRVASGLIVEHWDAVEEILSRDQWGNSGKF